METTQRSSTTLISILAMLVFLSLVGGLYWNKTRAMTDHFNLVERRADSLLSVKLQLEGDVSSLASQLETATDENGSLDKRISALQEQLYQRDVVEQRLRQQNRLRTGSIQGLHRNLDSMTTIRDSLENQLAAMADKISWMNDEKALLLNQTKELQQKLNNLNTTLLAKAPRSAITGDDFMVESKKSNRKETAKAKKVNALTVSLRIPAEMQLEGIQDVYLSLTDSQHNSIGAPLKTATITLSDINEVVPVHAIQRVNFSQHPQRISLNINPEHTLKPGKYRASVYTKDTYLGSVDFQLRDSFWFF